MPNYNQPPANQKNYPNAFPQDDEEVIKALRHNLLDPQHPIEVPFKERPQPIIHEPSKGDIHEIAEAGRRVVDDSKDNQAQAA